MSVSILVISHESIGKALIKVVMRTVGDLPLTTKIVSVSPRANPDLVYEKINQVLEEIDKGDGILILTDMFGSTPCNLAQRLLNEGIAVRVITGLNLPMLIRVMNYPTLGLDEMAEKAISGGREGVVDCFEQCGD